MTLLCALALGGCRDAFEKEQPHRGVRVEVRIEADDTKILTRATDQSSIRDVNYYLVARDNSVQAHGYLTTTHLRFECLAGEYTLYVIANIHKDMGALTPRQIFDYALAFQNSYAELPMSGEAAITIDAGAGAVILPAVQVRRVVAKVDYTITVDPATDIRLESVQPFNLPRQSTLFGTTTPPTAASAYMAGELHRMGEEQRRSCRGSFYQFENPQGEVKTITSQQMKNTDLAPANASYLLIRAVRGSKALAYKVFLGENNTSDFNIRRNTSHTLNITLHADSELDTRVSAYTAAVYDDMADAAYADYYVKDDNRRLYMDVAGQNNTFKLCAEIEVTRGDGSALSVNADPVGEYYEFSDFIPEGRSYFPISYAPVLFDHTNSELAYTVTLYDLYGFAQTYDFSYRFANSLRLQVNDGTAEAAKRGTIAVSGALHVQKSGKGLLALCSAQGCTLRATPAAGYRFLGWYADAALTRMVSTAATYTFLPAACNTSLYAKFRLTNHTALDDAGTANCYIAPQLNTAYSFDARTMGCGRSSTGITPRTLAGAEARVLWETGTSRGDVVRYAVLDQGRIYFSTGSTRGNALLGLFDTQGQCLWSWHIWAVNYDPNAQGVTYSSGYTFMDRNLGAVTMTATDPAAKGLYYQWGRKDPFLGPQKYDGGSFAAATYAAGFGPQIYSPQFHHDAQGNSTVAWSIAHPTTFMGAAPNPAGSSPAYYSSWCYPPNPNLWGNATTGTTLSTASSKSIYDPCPAGWRVPPVAAWDKTSFRKAGNATPGGWYMYYGASSKTTYYPFTGYLSDSAGSCNFISCASRIEVWTNTPALSTQGRIDYARYYYILESGVVNDVPLFQDEARTVRCVKE